MEFLTQNYDSINERMETLDVNLQNHREHIQMLEDKLVDFKLKSRVICIKIRNISRCTSERKEELLSTFMIIGKALNIPLQSQLVCYIFHVNTNHLNNKMVIVDFVSVLFKERFLKAYKKYKKENTIKLSIETLKFNDLVKPVFISENLTSKMALQRIMNLVTAG